MASTEEYVARLLAHAPKPTPEQLARVAAVLLPVSPIGDTGRILPVGAR